MKRVFLEYPYLTSLPARITKWEMAGKKVHLVTDRTIFYPDMVGGQPRDVGQINTIPVVDVYEKDGEIYHVLNQKPKGNEVTIFIDGNVRLDHMQQHTAQHILSAFFLRIFQIETLGFSIQSKDSYIDLEIPYQDYDFTIALNQVFALANEAIGAALEIKAYETDELHEGSSPTPMKKRYVEIATIDRSPCGGTHLANTAELLSVQLLKTETKRGNLRLYYLAGQRSLNHYQSILAETKNLANLFQTSPQKAIGQAFKLADDVTSLKKQISQYQEFCLSLTAQDLNKDKKRRHQISYIQEEMNSQLLQLQDLAPLLEADLVCLTINLDDQVKFLILARLDFLNLRSLLEEIKKTDKVRGGGSKEQIQGSASKDVIDKLMAGIFSQIDDQFGPFQ